MTYRRADVELVSRGLFSSREQARAAILAGLVRVDGRPLTKAGENLRDDAVVEVTQVKRYVSRGGHKLEAALDRFGIDVTGMRAIDVGASTGGFTDCLLKRGAASVVAVDVGYGQLDWSLRNDPRVTVLERTHIRDLDPAFVGAPFDLVVCDVSFISLVRVLPRLVALAGENGSVIALVKPQFEAGKGRVGKKGVVRDAAVHVDVLESVMRAVEDIGWVVRGLTWSPLKGPQGNIEFLAWFASSGEPSVARPADVVAGAHEALGD
ncbi:MAG: TlyA family RNA methyltransferase [Coriobacteriales bacterium]|nr:TlyA family RNA methyltransferase [Actinomycetes bacterium]